MEYLDLEYQLDQEKEEEPNDGMEEGDEEKENLIAGSK